MPPQIENQVPPNTPPSIQNSHKHTRLVLLTIVMILVGIMAVGYFWYQTLTTPQFPNPNQESPSTFQARDISNWKTYRNEEYEFELKYPNDWILESDKDKDSTSLDSPENFRNPNRRIEILIAYDKNPNNLTAKEYYNGTNGIKAFDNPTEDKEIIVGNQKAYELYPTTGEFPGKIVIIPKEQIFIRFDTALIKENTGIVLGQILSTFKFISTSTTNQLPPDPGEAGKATLEGVDSDKDGVRDDVQIAISLNWSESELKQKGLEQFTKALSVYMLSTSENEAKRNNVARQLSTNCMYSIDRTTAANDIKKIKSFILNTEERLKAYYRAEELKGTTTGITDSNACGFDIESLQN